jgi:hypothetical protein
LSEASDKDWPQLASMQTKGKEKISFQLKDCDISAQKKKISDS